MPDQVTIPAGAVLARISEIPDSCTCTWSWGPPSFRWERIGPKDTCPWHRAGDTLMAKLRQP